MPPPTCTKCGEALIGSGRFCASCGTPAFSTSPMVPVARPGGSSAPADRTPPTKTAPPIAPAAPPPPAGPPTRGSSYGPPPAPPSPSGYAPPTPYAQPYPQPPPGYTPYAPPPGYAPYAPPGVSYASAAPVFAVGTRVLVQWADGNRYPGVVQQLAPGQSLVAFPDGQQRWVENVYLTMAV